MTMPTTQSSSAAATTAWSPPPTWRAPGSKVLVLERREMLGGCAVTEEIWPGYRVSTGAYLTSLLQERIVRELELPRFGYQVEPKTPPSSPPSPTAAIFFMWQDERKTLAEIAKFSERDAEVYPAYEAQLERLLASGGIAAADHAAAISAAQKSATSSNI